MRTLKSFLLLFVVVGVSLSSCSSNTPVLRPTDATMATPTVFSTTTTFSLVPEPTPAPTLTPTNTPFPTSTPTVTPMPAIEHRAIVTEFLADVELLFYDPFDKINNLIWNSDQFGNITDGIYELKGISNWRTYLSPKEKYYGGGGILLKFKLQNANGKSAFTFDTGMYATDSDKGFGIINGKYPQVVLVQGKNAPDYRDLYGNLSLKPDTWYYVLMAMDTDENLDQNLFTVIWEPADETHRAVFSTKMGKNWSDKAWIFYVRVNEGETMYIDDFYRISFAEIKHQ